MDPTYVNKIQEWVRLDNQLLRAKEESAECVDKKRELEDEIIKFVTEKKLENLTINISDGAIKFPTTNTKAPLNIKTLKGLLEKYSQEVAFVNTNELLKFINDNLETKSKVSIRRDLKKQWNAWGGYLR